MKRAGFGRDRTNTPEARKEGETESIAELLPPKRRNHVNFEHDSASSDGEEIVTSYRLPVQRPTPPVTNRKRPPPISGDNGGRSSSKHRVVRVTTRKK